MNKFILFFIVVSFLSIANAVETAVKDCLEKIDKIYTSVGEKADFIIGPSSVTIAGKGPTKVYSASGLVTIDGLGCKTDREKKISYAAGDAFYGLVIQMQKGLTKDKPRKAIFENEEINKKINETAVVCRQFSSELMDDALNMLTISERQQGEPVKASR